MTQRKRKAPPRNARGKRTPKQPPSRADRNIAWIEKHCRIPEGADVGKAVRLRPWQRDDIRKIYDNPAGTRLAILSFAKKNAKTSLAAFLLLLHLCGPEAKQNTTLPSTAQSKEQAAVLFKLAAKIVRMSPALADCLIIRDTIKEIYCPELGTLYKALSADAATAHGLSPIFAVHDELGQVKGPISELFNAIENAMGAHEAPMSIVISTQAPTDADLLSVLIDDALTGVDPTIVCSLYTADMSLDPYSEEAIRQANPAFGDFLNAKEVLHTAEKAKRLPAEEPLYRNYVLNQRVEVNSPAISKSVWMSCFGVVVPDFGSRPIYGGLDLSEVNDLTAFVAIAEVDGAWHVKPTFWLPEEGLREKARKDRQPFDQWARDGFLTTVPGKSIEYSFVAKHIAELISTKNVQKIAFDRWGWRHFRPWLLQQGLTEAKVDSIFIEFGQGYQSMSPAWRDLESALLAGRIRHSSHPVMNMCAANAVIKRDEAGNRKLDKSKSRSRIDGLVALTMAHGAAPEPLEVSQYDLEAAAAKRAKEMA